MLIDLSLNLVSTWADLSVVGRMAFLVVLLTGWGVHLLGMVSGTLPNVL